MELNDIKNELRTLSVIEPDEDSWRAVSGKIRRDIASQTSPKQSNRIGGFFQSHLNELGRMSAAAVFLVAIFIGLSVLMRPTLSKAEMVNVVSPFVDLKNISFTMTLRQQDYADQRSQLFFQNQTKIKQITSNGIINLVDLETSKSLTFYPDQKHVVQTDLPVQAQTVDMVEAFKQRIAAFINSHDNTVKQIGSRQIRGIPAEGYLLTTEHLPQKLGPVKVWVRKNSLEPVLISYYDKMLGVETIIDDIDTQPRLDGSFSMEISPEYSIETKSSIRKQYTAETLDTQTIEARIINMFSAWADISGGSFPERIAFDVFREFDPEANVFYLQRGWRYSISYQLDLMTFFTDTDNPAQQDLEDLGVAIKETILPGIAQVYHLPEDSNWYYSGRGVTLGQSQQEIFRYKPDAGSGYRIIYGDLSVRNVPAEEAGSMKSQSAI